MKLNTSIKNIIEVSLIVLGAKSLLFLLFSIISWNNFSFYVEGVQILIFILCISQLYAIEKRARYTWILSGFQLILIYFFSQGTFEWLFSYLLKPFSIFQPIHSYMVASFLFVSELIKTAWLYKRNH